MKTKEFVGKKLGDVAKQTSVSWHPIHVFVLQDECDNVGKHLMDSYSLQQVIVAYPTAAAATVIYADDYLGETVIRIRIQEDVQHE